MALEKCSECGTQVSSTARTCPKCGRNFYGKTDTQKLMFIVVGVILVLVILVAMGKIVIPPLR